MVGTRQFLLKFAVLFLGAIASITPVYTEINPAQFDFPYKKIAQLLSKRATEKNKSKIAVLTYQSMDRQATNLGEIISEQIIVELVNNSNLNVVERSQVQKLLKELQFNQTGAIDAAAAKKIGNGLGADVLVIGSFTLVGDNEIMLFTKLVDTETFQVLGASQDSAKRSRNGKVVPSTTEVYTDQLVNRKVLILDFVNTRNSVDYKYLENSIPDSFLDPLDRTKSFELLPRSTWQKFITEGRFAKEDAYKEEAAIKAGRMAGADVVIMGSFAALTDKMQIFTNAIELSSGRVMVSRSISAPLSNNMFEVINKLTRDMSVQMKEKLPPLPQKVIMIERGKYRGTGAIGISEGPLTLGGMVWRTAVAPGWGHLYANQWRGWIYMPLWAGSVGTFVYGIVDYNIKYDIYFAANSGLEAAYADYNNARILRNASLIAVLSVYAISLTDILITGNSYTTTYQRSLNHAPESELNFSLESGLDGFNVQLVKKW